MLMTISGLGAFAPTSSAYAQSAPQPTPRPALPPEKDGDSDANSQDMAHVTGTVIDQTTGAPVPNVQVQVGDKIVMTDANGNYDLWLEPGDYTIITVAADGTPQQAVQVVLPSGQMVVQHLAWAPPIVATAVPTPVASQAVTAPEQVIVKTEGAMPGQLPHTAGNPLFLLGDWFWVSLGFALILGGIIVGTRADALHGSARMLARYAARQPRSNASADTAAFLAALLTSEVRAATPRDDALLYALLDRDAQRRRNAQDLLAELLQNPVIA